MLKVLGKHPWINNAVGLQQNKGKILQGMIEGFLGLPVNWTLALTQRHGENIQIWNLQELYVFILLFPLCLLFSKEAINIQ